MMNTIAVVALTNIGQETEYFHDFCAVYKTNVLSPFLSLGYALGMFLNFKGHFLASRSF